MRKTVFFSTLSLATYLYLRHKATHKQKHVLSTFTNSFTTRIYKNFRPLLFALVDPETAHKLAVASLRQVGQLSFWSQSASYYPEISSVFFGSPFSSPVGVAAGFDKNGEAIEGLSRLPVGHVEIGSVSAQAWPGNPKPRIFRLPEVAGILNRMGLNNQGAEVVAKRLAELRRGGKLNSRPIGVNITKTPDASIVGESAIQDFVTSFTHLAPFADWITLNVSCPNTSEGKTFEQDLDSFRDLIHAVFSKRKELGLSCPIFVKLSPLREGQDPADVLELVRAGVAAGCDGFVLANTVSDRGEDLGLPAYVQELGRGGISGKSIYHRTRKLVQYIASETGGGVPIIAVGGVTTAQDAWELLTSGASLVQLYTSMIYQGPGIFDDINNGLARLMVMKGVSESRPV